MKFNYYVTWYDGHKTRYDCWYAPNAQQVADEVREYAKDSGLECQIYYIFIECPESWA